MAEREQSVRDKWERVGILIVGDQVEVDIPKLLAAMGYEDTEENRDLCVDLSEKVLKESGLITPTAKVDHTHNHRCPNCGKSFQHPGKRKKCPLPKKSFCPTCSS